MSKSVNSQRQQDPYRLTVGPLLTLSSFIAYAKIYQFFNFSEYAISAIHYIVNASHKIDKRTYMRAKPFLPIPLNTADT